MHDPGPALTKHAHFQYLLLGLAVGTMLVVPLALRGVSISAGPHAATPSYLPALEPSRDRLPFREEPIDQLRRLQPEWVFIGDSILGTRVDVNTFSESNGMTTVGMLLQPGTGPAWWYLAFKNWLVASGERPRLTFIFFRDYQLTDTMFRLTDQYRWSLDEVAHDSEPLLNNIVAARMQGPWSTVRARVERTYGADRVRDLVEPALKRWPAWLLAPPDRQGAVLAAVNERFELDRLRPMTAADASFADEAEADFHAMLPSSVLPAIVRLARASQLRVCFVRAKRRPPATARGLPSRSTCSGTWPTSRRGSNRRGCSSSTTRPIRG